MKLGQLVEKAQQIVSVCKEEYAQHRVRVREIEKKYHVKFEWEDGMLMSCDKKFYPDDAEACYSFSYDEWLDGIPKAKKLYLLNMKWMDSWGRLSKRVKTRCELSNIEEDEIGQEFVVENMWERVHFIGSYGVKNWEEFTIEIYRKER